MDAAQTCPGCGALLVRDEAGDEFCARCLLSFAFDSDPEDTVEADQVGPYRLIEVLGTGGMGVVYLAEQQEPLRRLVAVKFVKPSMDGDTILRRFETERQALARMTHPGIARVLDAGADAKGRPYFVMEVVDGVAITRYCDESRLPVRARLELFAELCDAVQHAHEKGIVHRDLKPTNILITELDGRPVPKVIDFGVAKALNQGFSDRTLLTELGIVVGTPEYMSPEQADPRLGDVDTRTDIYALGVLLYELLVGVPPFDPVTLRRSTTELHRIIRDVDPPTPSTRLTGLGNGAQGVAHRRQTSLTSLRHDLRGDLDWVVMKAIEKERTRRYPSANALADDIRHYLAHEPVGARRPSMPYRLRKLFGRHRVGFASAAAMVLAVIVGVGTGLVVSSRVPSAQEALDGSIPAELEVLTRSGRAGHSLVSPGGDKVVFTQPNLERKGSTLWLADVATSRIERLGEIVIAYPLLHWSRDGRYIYLAVDDTKGGPSASTLARFSIATRRVEELQASGTLPGWPAIAPDERRLAGVREDRQHRRSVLVVANLDGSGEREVAVRPIDDPYLMPAWSPDGRTIASTVGHLGIIGKPMRVVAVDVTDGRERLLSHESWVRAGAKTWLPDGRGLLLLGQKWGHRQSADSWLWRLDSRTGQTQPVQIGPDELSGWQISLSANGKTLSGIRTKLATSLWVLEGTDVSTAKEVTAPLWEGPRFFPDGRLVFTGPDWFLWRANADGSDKVRLVGGSYKDVSPDGRSLVYAHAEDGVSQIWRADSDGQNPVQITHGPAATKPAVSRDGKWIVYITAVDGALWKIPFMGGIPVRLADGIAESPSVSPDGEWVAVRYRDPTGADWYPALVRMSGGGIARKLRLPEDADLWFLQFSRDGKALDAALAKVGFSQGAVGNLWRLPLDRGPARQLTHFTTEELRSFDWSRDGKYLACLRGGWRGDIVLLRGGW